MISILIIGNEILSAQVENSNLRHMLHTFAKKGITVDQVRIVRDSVQDISKALNDLRKKSRFVVSTGGLGPTHDDVTMKAFADAFQVPLKIHRELESRMRNHFKDRLKPAHLTMANLPENAELIDSGAHRFPLVQVGNCFALPGLPELFLEKLSELISLLPGGVPLFYAEIRTHASETSFAAELENIAGHFESVEIGSYPNYDRSQFAAKITLKSPQKDLVKACFDAVVSHFKDADLFLSATKPQPYKPLV